MSIRSEIAKHLKSKGDITRLEALGLYGCMDVTTVIRDLRRGSRDRKPMNIKTHYKYDQNGKVYARYSYGNANTRSMR